MIQAALGLSLLLAVQSRMSFPGGSVVIPHGCTAPAEIEMGVDAWMGSIDCAKGTGILVFGSLMAGKVCSEAAPSKGASVSVKTTRGQAIKICPSDRSDTAEVVMAVGGTTFRTQARTPSDVLRLLGVVASFEVPGKR